MIQRIDGEPQMIINFGLSTPRVTLAVPIIRMQKLLFPLLLLQKRHLEKAVVGISE